VAAGSLLVQEAGGLVGNFSGEADFLDQQECMAGNPRVYAQLVGILGKYSKFAGAGEKAAVRQSTLSISPRGQSKASAEANSNTLAAADTSVSAAPAEVAPIEDADAAPL
jgi:myo-inositol-1(or 4)-monophosphatase